jgi:hypothetical protein
MNSNTCCVPNRRMDHCLGARPSNLHEQSKAVGANPRKKVLDKSVSTRSRDRIGRCSGNGGGACAYAHTHTHPHTPTHTHTQCDTSLRYCLAKQLLHSFRRKRVVFLQEHVWNFPHRVQGHRVLGLRRQKHITSQLQPHTAVRGHKACMQPRVRTSMIAKPRINK